MFRPMRRLKRQLADTEARETRTAGRFGTLAYLGDESWPYAVPLSYAVEGDSIYIHCATEGQKLNAIRREPRVSFCVVGQDRPMPGEYTAHYRSAIAYGRARMVKDDASKRRALMCISRKYNPGRDEVSRQKIEAAVPPSTYCRGPAVPASTCCRAWATETCPVDYGAGFLGSRD